MVSEEWARSSEKDSFYCESILVATVVKLVWLNNMKAINVLNIVLWKNAAYEPSEWKR
jgi:hypothetical protein